MLELVEVLLELPDEDDWEEEGEEEEDATEDGHDAEADTVQAEDAHVDDHAHDDDHVSFVHQSDQLGPVYRLFEPQRELFEAFTAFTAADDLEERGHKQDQHVEDVEYEHGAHVDHEVLRLEPDLLETVVDGLSRLDPEIRMHDLTEVIEVERSDLHDLTKEHVGVGWHLDLKQGHHDK